MKAGRIPCVVPGCRRTIVPALPSDDEGICQNHWRTIPLISRQLYRDRREELFAAQAETQAYQDAGGVEPWELVDNELRLQHVVRRLWRWLKRRAIERAVGI